MLCLLLVKWIMIVMQDDPIVIVNLARTPMGAFQGAFASLTSPQLGSIAIKAAVQRSGLELDQIQEVSMGCVLTAGLGQAPARQSALGAGLSDTTSCATINKVCGSGMKAIMIEHDALLANNPEIQIAVAGGMESMTNAPYYMERARSGLRMGHGQIHDEMFVDGLEDAYSKGTLMGVFADATAEKYNISREEQDIFALRSLELAQQAIKNNWFEQEITPVTVKSKIGEEQITIDEIPGRCKPEKVPHLKPAFGTNGTVTAANSSSISDGATALVLMRQSMAEQLKLRPVAKILGHASVAGEPQWFTTAPIAAIQKLLLKTGLKLDQIDLFEINEAFAVVALVAIKELKLDINKVNVFGGACALGHPIGDTGARIVCTLISALCQYNKRIGIASVCIGGGEATAIAIEVLGD